MALSILNNIPSLAAQNQLTITGASLQKTLFRLSSGSRINSGADDAAGLAIADGLRANVTALTQSARNANDGMGMLQVADGALSQVTTLLNRAVTLATESATGTVSDGSQRAALNSEFESIKAEIDRIGQKTTFNGAAIFASGGANTSQWLSGASGAGRATAVSGTLVVKAGATTLVTTTAQDTTVGAVIDRINNSGKGVVASVNAAGNLVIADAAGRSGANALALDAATGTFEIGGESSADVFVNPTNSSSVQVYLSDSTGSGSSTISVTLGQFDSGNINGVSLSNDDLTLATNAKTALTNINNAIAQVAALRGNIGGSINRLQAASSVMNNQVQNLSAAEDGIRAADIAQEVANMTKFNILQQTGISALAQANQMQQGVLSLLR